MGFPNAFRAVDDKQDPVLKLKTPLDQSVQPLFDGPGILAMDLLNPQYEFASFQSHAERDDDPVIGITLGVDKNRDKVILGQGTRLKILELFCRTMFEFFREARCADPERFRGQSRTLLILVSTQTVKKSSECPSVIVKRFLEPLIALKRDFFSGFDIPDSWNFDRKLLVPKINGSVLTTPAGIIPIPAMFRASQTPHFVLKLDRKSVV